MKFLRKAIQNNPLTYLIIVFAGIALLLPVFIIRSNREKNYSIRTGTDINYVDDKLFVKGINFAKSQEPFTQKVSGAIIPHHQLASHLIAQLYKGMRDQTPSTIILIGPNHFEKGNYYALSSDSAWSTFYGDVFPDKEVIEKLVNSNHIQLDNQTVSQEFSISTCMPYIKYFLPDTQIVPIILSGRMTIEQTEKLAQVLSTMEYPIVASVDFSHYLSSDEAQKRDSETLKILEDYNIQRLFSLNNEYLDSPPSIAILLSAMQKRGKMNFKELQNTNSGNLTNDKMSPVTSYFSIIYFQ